MTNQAPASFNERFQAIAERNALRAGRWPHFVFWAVLIIAWAALGPVMRFSDSWQLLVNTPTTVFELFLELTILAGQARQERGKEEILRNVREIVTLLATRQTTILAEQQTIKRDLERESADIDVLVAVVGELDAAGRHIVRMALVDAERVEQEGPS